MSHRSADALGGTRRTEHGDTQAGSHQNRGKRTPRERITALVDSGSFQEIHSFLTQRFDDFGMADKKIEGDAVVAGSYAPLTAGLLRPVPADMRLAEHKRHRLDRRYQRIVSDLDALLHQVGLKIAA